jgi:Glycosyl hydrolase family 115/Glycosyl hydrolase family 67 N-terminus
MTDRPAFRVLHRLGTMLVVAAVASVALGQRAAHRGEGEFGLDHSVTILVSGDEPGPVQLAVADLASDFEKVLGRRPNIVTRMEDAGPETILVGEVDKLPSAMRPKGLTAPESFSIAADMNRRGHVVVLSGADMRGTLYAIYQFSQEHLGIDPMYYWTDHVPEHRSQISIPSSLAETFPAPVFKYRGFFINDEDLLTGWAPGAKDKTGISLDAWNKVYETILRMKGNMVVPGTWIFPDDPQVALAGKRGLILTQHHAIPLGVNVARWPKDVPYNYSTHPEILERAWKDAVATYSPKQEILWDVGLRGLSDVSYAAMDPSVQDNDKALGALISKAIAEQIKIVRAVRPDAKFVTDLWQEGARLVQQGFLTIPPDVITVWADTGYGDLQDGGKVAAGQGAYYHTAMMNNRANQLTEMVPIERIVSEMGRYQKAGATEYFLVNTSDIRPVPMTTNAVMEFAWKGVPEGGADEYSREWTREEFGQTASSALTQMFKDYFNAPAQAGQPAKEYGDQLYHTEGRQLMLTYMIDSPLYTVPSQAPKWQPPRFVQSRTGEPQGRDWMLQTARDEIQQCGGARPRWDAVWKEANEAKSLIPADRQQFYVASVLTMITINRESNDMLYLISKSIVDANDGRQADAEHEAEDAVNDLKQVEAAQSSAEYGQWKNWYRGDWLTNVSRTREIAEIFARYLEDPLTRLAAPLVWSNWEAYYHIMRYEGDRSADVK